MTYVRQCSALVSLNSLGQGHHLTVLQSSQREGISRVDEDKRLWIEIRM